MINVKNQIPIWCIFILLTMSFPTKPTYIVTFTSKSLTFPNPDIKKHELADAPTKSLLHSICPNFTSKRHSSVIASKKKWKSPNENSVFKSKVCTTSSKLLITRATVYKFHYQNPKPRSDIQSQITIFLLITIKVTLQIQTDKFDYRAHLETTILAPFPSKSLNYRAINWSLQKLSTLTIAKFTTSTRTDVAFRTSVKQLRAITMCSAFTPGSRYDKSNNKIIGKVYWERIQCVWV